MLHILFEVHQIHKKEVCILVSDCGELGKTVKTSQNFWIAYFHDIHNSLLWKAYSFSFEMKSQIISQINIMLQISIQFVGRHDFHRRGHTLNGQPHTIQDSFIVTLNYRYRTISSNIWHYTHGSVVSVVAYQRRVELNCMRVGTSGTS